MASEEQRPATAAGDQVASLGAAALLLIFLGATGCGQVVFDGEPGAPAGGDGARACHPRLPSPATLPAPPVLWYAFDGDADNTGSAGPQYMGIADVTWVDGVLGKAAKLGNITLPGTHALLASLSPITIALWVKPDFVYGTPFLSCRVYYGGFESYHGNYDDTRIVTCAGTASQGGCATFDAGDACWHHVLYRYASTTPGGSAPLDLYLDGRKVDSVVTEDGKPIFGAAFDTVDLSLGGTGGAHHLVDDLRVYGQVFSEEEQCTGIVGGSWTDGSCQLP